MRKRAALAFGLTGSLVAIALATVAIPTQTGCTTRQCAPGLTQWCNQLTADKVSCLSFHGHWTDPATMEQWATSTSDVTDDWIPYTGEMFVDVYYPDTGRFPTAVHLYVGVTEHNSGSPDNPTTGGGPDVNPSWAEAAGALDTYTTWGTWGIGFYNATCADYVAYVVVDFPALTPAQRAAIQAASGASDAGNEDAMTDASAPDGTVTDGAPADGPVATTADAPTD